MNRDDPAATSEARRRFKEDFRDRSSDWISESVESHQIERRALKTQRPAQADLKLLSQTKGEEWSGMDDEYK